MLFSLLALFACTQASDNSLFGTPDKEEGAFSPSESLSACKEYRFFRFTPTLGAERNWKLGALVFSMANNPIPVKACDSKYNVKNGKCENAYDPNVDSSYGHTEKAGGWLQFDLGREYPADTIQIYPKNKNTCVKAYRIEAKVKEGDDYYEIFSGDIDSSEKIITHKFCKGPNILKIYKQHEDLVNACGSLKANVIAAAERGAGEIKDIVNGVSLNPDDSPKHTNDQPTKTDKNEPSTQEGNAKSDNQQANNDAETPGKSKDITDGSVTNGEQQTASNFGTADFDFKDTILIPELTEVSTTEGGIDYQSKFYAMVAIEILTCVISYKFYCDSRKERVYINLLEEF